MLNGVSTKITAHVEKTKLINELLTELGIKAEDKVRPLANPMLQKFFRTEAGKEARAMNLAALNGIKKGVTERPKALAPEDIKLLASNEAEMVKKWVSWVSPKSGKSYTIINKGDNPDSTRTVRVLNEAGEVVTEKNVVPKKIVVLDIFKKDACSDITCTVGSHGDMVQKIAERNNPIADIESIDVSDSTIKGRMDDSKLKSALDDLLKRIKAGEKIDVINCSFSTDYKPGLTTKINKTYDEGKILTSYTVAKKIAEDDKEKISKYEKFKSLISEGVQVVFIAGNKGADTFNLNSCIDGMDVVGGLNSMGKMYTGSASRAFTKHLELCQYRPKILAEGINITGLPGADISYKGAALKLTGKKAKDCLATREDCLEYLNLYKDYMEYRLSEEDFRKACKKFENKIMDDEQKRDISRCTNEIIFKLNKEDSLNINSLDGATKIKDGDINKIKDAAQNLGDAHYTFEITKDGTLLPHLSCFNLDTDSSFNGTSFAAPARTAKIVLNKAMKELLEE